MRIKMIEVSQIYNVNINEKFEAISNINLNVSENEFIGIIGPTGSGKTTLIEHLNGLLIPSKGKIEFFYDVEKIDKKTNIKKIEKKYQIIKKSWRKIKKINQIRKRIGLVFQFAEYQLFEETIEKDIIFGPLNMGFSKEESLEIAKDVIKKVGLDESFLKRNPFELSGGQKRRVAIAGILAMKPDVLVLDEPTAGLDPKGCDEILKLFDKLHKEGMTILIVSHNLDDILKYTNRTIFLKDGQIIKDDKTINILSDIEFLIENEMYVPKLISLTNKLNKKYNINIPYTRSINEFINIINKIKEENKWK